MLAAGAFVLFLANAAAILVAGIAVFAAAGYQREAEHRDARAGRAAKALIVALLVALVVPLGYESFRTFQYERWTNRTQSATQQWLEGTSWHLEGVENDNGEIIVNVIGPGRAPSLAALRTAVRRGVPARVKVRVVEDSGAAYDL